MEIEEIARGDEKAMGFPGTSSTEGSSLASSSSVKRKRMFQAHWKESWPWLVLKESQGERAKMFCNICLKYPDIAISHSGSGRNAFVNGCDQLRIESIRAHETSKAHMACFLRNNPGLETSFKAQRLLKLDNFKKKKKPKTFRNEKAAESQSSSPNGKDINFSLSNRNHEAGKRKRVFQARWKESWPWLVLNEREGEEPKMFCSVCLTYSDVAESHSVSSKNAFLSGCNQFRIEPIRAHEKSKSHTTCVSLCSGERKHSVMDPSLFKNEQTAHYKQAAEFPAFRSSKQTSLSSPTSRKNKKYDSEKRKRVFQAHWKESWSWLFLKETKGESPKMHCSICLKYPDLAVSHSPSGKCSFLSGCDQFRVEPIKAHETSKAHKMCISLYNQEMEKTVDPAVASDTGSASPTVKSRAQFLIVQALQKLKEIERKRLMVLFTNAYCIAKQGMPLSDMDILCSAMKTAGVDLGDNYTNREKASEFIKCEAEVIRQDIKEIVLNSRFICIVADGSADSALVEQETVLVRVVNEGKPYTVFADLVPLEHAHAPSLMDGIVNGIKKISLDFEQMKSSQFPGPTLVSVNFDGAAVMMESKGGVAALLKNDIPFLLPFYCVTHKLLLGILDVVKQSTYISQFEETLKWIFKFYWKNSRKRQDAKKISKVIQENFAHFSDIKEARWVSGKAGALQAVQHDLHTVVVHLEQIGTRSDESSARAGKYLSSVTSVKFITALYRLRDILETVAQLSEFLKRDNILLIHVQPAIERCVSKLEILKSDLGDNMQQFYNLYHPEQRTFGDHASDGWEIQLSGPCPSAPSIRDVQLVEKVIEYIDERFSHLNSMPYRGFQVFDYTIWPEGTEELDAYGKDDLHGILMHFDVLFSIQEKLAIIEEFSRLKTHLHNFKKKSIPVVCAYSTLLTKHPSNLSNILKLVEMMFTMSVSTAEAERAFLAMNVVKHRQRSRLHQAILQDLMLIKMEGPKFEDFDPCRAIEYWLSARGTKHVRGHKRPYDLVE